MVSPRLTAEIWTRPGHASFGKVIADVPVISCSGTEVVNGIGEGRITIPKNYSRLDEILKPDITTPANAVSSLVRVFSERSTTPIFEFIPIQFTGEQDKADPDIEISGPAIDSIWGYARLEAWDWTGADDEKSLFPDWIWGGRNILGDLESAYEPAVTRMWTDADGGTFTIGISVDGGGFQTTSALAYNASAATVRTALIALSNVTDINVNGAGTATDPWRIQSVDPEGEYLFIDNSGSLIGPWQVEVAGASGGTWTATIDGATTAAIARNASAATVKTEIEALATVTTVTVTRGSTSDGFIWLIYFDTPDTITTFTVTDSLTPAGATVVATHLGGAAYQNLETIGRNVPQGWTTSFNPVTQLPHGQLDEFRISDGTGSDPALPACDTSGMSIMFNGGATGIDLYPGVQKIVPVKPGGRYYAHVSVYAQGVADTYRFVIRDLYEQCIAGSPSCDTGTAVTANTWTDFDIPLIDIPDDIDRVIFRIASVSAAGANPPTFVACLELREGMPPDTWGEYLTQLHADATADHAPGRVVWEDGTTNLPYLSLDFDAALTSAGDAWADSEVAITLKRGQNYLRVLSEAYKMGYEGRVVPDDVANGTWQLQVYNTGDMGVNHTLVSNGPSIQGGRDVTRRDLRRYLPASTDVAVEGGGQNIARAQNANAITALGRIEAYQPNQDLGTLIEAGLVADQSLTQSLSRSQSLTYILTPAYTDPQPFIDYNAGDTIYVLDPPDVPTREARRIKSLQFTFTKDTVQYTVQLESASFAGVGPTLTSSVDFLMKEFKAIRAQPPEPTDILNYFQDPCCPSCPAILVGTVVTMNKTATFFDWTISNDPDQIMSADVGGNLFFRRSGLYSAHLNFQMHFPVIATGWANWKIHSFASNDDGNDGSQYILSAAVSGGNMFIQANIFQWAHLFADGEQYNAGWEMLVEQSASLVTGTSGVLDACGLVIIRHTDGCAREAESV